MGIYSYTFDFDTFKNDPFKSVIFRYSQKWLLGPFWHFWRKFWFWHFQVWHFWKGMSRQTSSYSVIILWCRFTVMPFFTYSMIGFVQKNDCAHFSKYLSNSQMRHPILSICSKGKWKGAESEVIKYLRSPIHTRLWQH